MEAKPNKTSNSTEQSSGIDLVLPWVDGNDPLWLAEKNQYEAKDKVLNTPARYKNWDNLHFLFRGIERAMPWVRHVHFITWGHIPPWLNINHPKIKIVNHSDFIPSEFLPVFSSHPIEMFLHKIPNLSEQFIYFNDDLFVLRPTKKEDFFRNGLPVDFAIMDTVHDGTLSHIVLNNIDRINKNFNRHVHPRLAKNTLIKRHWSHWFHYQYGFSNILQNIFLMKWKGHTGFVINHHPQAYLKDTFKTVWEKEPAVLTKTAQQKFRTNHDVNQYLFRYWQLLSAKFHPANYKIYKTSRKYVEVRTLADAQRIADDIVKGELQFVCINDATSAGRYTREDISTKDFEIAKSKILHALEAIYPNASSYELT